MFFYYKSPCGICSYFGYNKTKTAFMYRDNVTEIEMTISELQDFVTEESKTIKEVFVL